MTTINGTYRNGRIELDRPVDWPDGKAVRVIEVTDDEPEFMTEETWPKTPEEIEEHIRKIEAVEPVELTPEDEKRINEARAAVKEYTLEKMRRRFQVDQP